MQKATNCSCTLFPNGNKVLIFMQLRLGHCKETSFPAFQLAIILPQSTHSDLELSNLVRIYYQNSLSSDTRELIYMYLESETWIFVRVEPNNSNPIKNCRILGCNLGFPAGPFRLGKAREGPGTERDRTGPRDFVGPVVLWSRD